MKNLIFLSLLCLLTGTSQAQGSFDPRAIGTQVMAKLVPALTLTDDQKPQVTEAVDEFLMQKAAIIPLKTSDPSAYFSKFNALNGGLISKLKTILVARQMTSFLGLKPKPGDTGNVLSHLFY